MNNTKYPLNATPKQKLITRLYGLANGATPNISLIEFQGICIDLALEFKGDVDMNDICTLFNAIRYKLATIDNDITHPLRANRYDFSDTSGWTGEIGNHRRTFAGFCAAWLETNELEEIDN